MCSSPSFQLSDGFGLAEASADAKQEGKRDFKGGEIKAGAAGAGQYREVRVHSSVGLCALSSSLLRFSKVPA